MAYKTQKSDQEWEKIRFQNSLGPQIGGLLHDSCALAIATKKVDPASIKHYLDVLYIIAEQKKTEITTPEPIDLDAAEKLGEQWKKDRIEAERVRIGAKGQQLKEETIEQ